MADAFGKTYAGPEFFRRIQSPFNSDPDWAGDITTPLPTTALLDMRNNLDGARFLPLTVLCVSFAFFDAANVQVAGGTLNAYGFYAVLPQYFSLPVGGRPVVYKLQTRTGAVGVPFYCTLPRQYSFGVRVSDIVAPVGAANLCITVSDLGSSSVLPV